MKERIQQLEKEIAELKAQLEKEFEEGQWVINNKTHKYLFKYTEGNYTTGFFDGVWGEWSVTGQKKTCCTATDKEVKEALVAEAKRRELVAENTIVTPRAGVKTTPNDNIYKYYHKIDGMEDVLTLNGWLIYYEGNWAEPVSDAVTINGVECEWEDSQISLSCGDYITKGNFVSFHSLVDKYDLTVHREGEDITPQIKKLGEQI